MTIEQYFAKMEGLEYQVQFVAAGFQSLLRMFSYEPTIRALIADLRNQPSWLSEIRSRIKYLLTKFWTDIPEAYDETIAAYLYCLSKVDAPTAYRASADVLKTERKNADLWWAFWLAQHLIKQQIANSVNTQSQSTQDTSFHITTTSFTQDWHSPEPPSQYQVVIDQSIPKLQVELKVA